jgi:hypothetical protein
MSALCRCIPDELGVQRMPIPRVEVVFFARRCTEAHVCCPFRLREYLNFPINLKVCVFFCFVFGCYRFQSSFCCFLLEN